MQLIAMKILYIIFVILSLKGCLSKELFKDPKERIKGGHPIDITDAPYQVCLTHRTLRKTHVFVCGGALFTDSMVLTAGHCIVGNDSVMIPTSDVRIFAGTTTLDNFDIYSDASWIRVHPDYRDDNRQVTWNDVAVIKLKKKFGLRAAVKPIALRSVPVNEGTSCIVSGWGSSTMHGIFSKDLMAAVVPIYNRQKCARAYELATRHPLPDGTICAGFDQGGIDSCKGDSGGPLVCDGMLTGIVSFGRGCGVVGYPGVYTEVYKHLNWIMPPLESRSGKAPPPRLFVSRHVLFTIIFYLFL